MEKKVDSGDWPRGVPARQTAGGDRLLRKKRARRIIRKTARMATHLNAAFTVPYAGRPIADDRIPLARQRYLINNLNLVTELAARGAPDTPTPVEHR